MNQQQQNDCKRSCAHKIPMQCRGLFREGWGGGVTISIEVNRQVSLMNWQISPFFPKYPISLTVTKILNTVSHYGISVEMKWIVYPIYQEEKWQMSCIPKTPIQTHYNSLHLYISGDKKKLFEQVLTSKASLHASVIYG